MLNATTNCFIGVMVTRLPPKEKIVGSSPIWNDSSLVFAVEVGDRMVMVKLS